MNEGIVVLLLGGVGALLAGAGALLVLAGFAARRQITAALLTEHATTPNAPQGGSGETDTLARGSEAIRDARTARLRAEEIRHHTHTKVGTFQQTAPDSAERQWFLNGLAIRTALNMAIMGYGVANLAIAVGAGMLLTAVALAGAGIPLARAAL